VGDDQAGAAVVVVELAQQAEHLVSLYLALIKHLSYALDVFAQFWMAQLLKN
jgi:hypothetical protein